MRVIFSTLSLALLASLAVTPATAETEYVEFNHDMRSLAGKGVSFLPLDPESVPAQHVLLGMAAAHPYGANDVVPTTPSYAQCTSTTNKEATGTVTVLIAISKCLGDYAQTQILNWATALQASQKTFFSTAAGLDASKITFSVASLPGACQAISEANTQGQASMLLSSEVLPEDVERLAAFSAIGRVLDSMPATNISSSGSPTGKTVVDNSVPIAVISFVDNYKSFQTVQQFEATEEITTTFNFQICQNGVNCGGDFADCIKLQDPVDLFMYSPFKVVSTFQCGSLSGGIPVTYVDSKNVRQCACTCPAGTKLNEDTKTCDAVPGETCKCVWENDLLTGGYKVSIADASESTKFTKLGTAGPIPGPIPVDNYVAKFRPNQNDANNGQLPLSKGPHIDLNTRRICDSPVYSVPIGAVPNAELASKGKYADLSAAAKNSIQSFSDTKCSPAPATKTATLPWSAYLSNRLGAIDSLEFPTYGKYALELVATDYNNSAARCPGCVAIVDNYRPHGDANNCPKKFCDDTVLDCTADEGVAELNSTNIDAVNTLVTKFYNFDSTSTNDACSRGDPDRCDVKNIKWKQFTNGEYVSSGMTYDDGKKFFDKEKVKSDLKTKLTLGGTLTSQSNTPVVNGECKRCIGVATELREWWVDYKCGRDYDIRKCEGDASGKCSFNQCLVVLGDSLAVATAGIKSGIKDESKRVIAELTQQGYNTETQVHVSLSCTQFVDNAKPADIATSTCKYATTVENLVDIKTVAKDTSILSDAEAAGIVYWRYRVDQGSWQGWGSSTTNIYFVKAETMVTVEAWTQCGLVRKFFFYVNLHLNNDIKVCDNFRSMWYQTTNDKLDSPDDLCMYPGSDFAEITFDYHANIGLQYSPDKLNMNISSVVCRLSYYLTKPEEFTPVEILRVERLSPEIVTRFAIEAIRSPSTLPKTSFHVTCDFKYKQYGNATLLAQTCNQDFSIRDCSGPEIDRPCLKDASCAADSCKGSSKPAPYETCGGNVVSARVGYAASFSTAAKSCCDFCSSNYDTSCKTLSTLPAGEDDIKRCEPVKKTTTSSYGLLAATTALEQTVQRDPTSAATVLLSASALVALVALVVVKRRRASSEKETVMDDAYYPLLN
ncbi:hypothetical protein Gpo141_00004815 [Globisporangium polare]